MEKYREASFIREKSLPSRKSLYELEKSWRTSNKIFWGSVSAAIALSCALLFYLNPVFIIITWPMGLVIYLSMRKRSIKKDKDILIRECIDALKFTETALRAGYAFENALISAEDELEKIWGNTGRLTMLWSLMNKRIELKEAAVDSFAGMARASKISDLEELALLIENAKRSSGGLSDLFQLFASQLDEKVSMETEIQGMLTEKRMEKNIMLLMPPGILFYLLVSSYDWISVLYETVMGRIFMTICLMAYALAWVLGERYLNIVV